MPMHFALIVARQPGEAGFSLDDALAPFALHPKSARYRTFQDKSELLRFEYEHGSVDPILWFTREVIEPHAALISTETEPCDRPRDGGAAPTRLTPLKELYLSFEDFVLEQGYSPDALKAGRIGYWHNPNARWSEWQIGGRWCGFFKVKAGFEHATRLGAPLRYDDPPPVGYADVLLKKHWDLDAQRDQNAQAARQRYAAFTHAQRCAPGAGNASAERVRSGGVIAIERVAGEPLAPCAAACTLPETGEAHAYPAVTRQTLARFAGDEEGLVAYVRQNTAMPFALLLDGQWFAEADPWRRDANRARMNPADWVRIASEMLAALPDDTELFAVDCYR
ncbi:hypothetical protein GCM10025771_09970 [Niveibacterium umoris]|uniref:Uncharacterized protein n=2 Tax=Niveibacterium umoris TaxID=1193620 RepID=A0A840BLF7_9RHOO|nr:hypothetical protein [Niveibacterium umoris]MBB4013453.1 hypothetical protein [Niveibacterium umoris]